MKKIVLYFIPFLLLFSSCIHNCKTLDCRFNKPVNSFTQKELNNFLDEARSSDYNIVHYWIPMMKKLIIMKKNNNLKWEIPRKHLKYFLIEEKVYSDVKNFKIYNIAVMLWYKGIIDGKASYRNNDKQFLEQYINNCINRLCPEYQLCQCLDTVKSISQRLDKELYNKYFK